MMIVLVLDEILILQADRRIFHISFLLFSQDRNPCPAPDLDYFGHFSFFAQGFAV